VNDEDKTLDRELCESHAWCQNKGYEWSAQVQQRAMAEIDRLRASGEYTEREPRLGRPCPGNHRLRGFYR